MVYNFIRAILQSHDFSLSQIATTLRLTKSTLDIKLINLTLNIKPTKPILDVKATV